MPFSSARTAAVDANGSVTTATAGIPCFSRVMASSTLPDEQLPQSPMAVTTAAHRVASRAVSSERAGALGFALVTHTSSSSVVDHPVWILRSRPSPQLNPDALDLLGDLAWLTGVPQHGTGAAGRHAHRRATPLADAGQGDVHVLRGIAEHRLRLPAPRHDRGLLEHPLAEQDDPPVALTQVLLRSVGDRPLADPGDEVPVHDVRGDPAPGRRVGDGTVPVRNTPLLERRGARQRIVEPGDVERVLVVDGDAPLELPGVQTVRPEADAPDRPQLVRFGRILAHASVHEPPVELREPDLEVPRHRLAILAPQAGR